MFITRTFVINCYDYSFEWHILLIGGNNLLLRAAFGAVATQRKSNSRKFSRD